MRHTLPILILAAVLVSPSIDACTCAGGSRPFLERKHRLVVQGRVDRYIHMRDGRAIAMVVEVEGVLSGNYKSSTIRILGDNGMQCIPYVTNFPVGTEWIFSVFGPHRTGGLGDENYSFGMCSTDWLVSFGGYAFGQLLGLETVAATIDDLERLLADKDAEAKLSKPEEILRTAQSDSPMPTFWADCPDPVESVSFDLMIDDRGQIRTVTPVGRLPSCLCCLAVLFRHSGQDSEKIQFDSSEWSSLLRIKLSAAPSGGADVVCDGCLKK